MNPKPIDEIVEKVDGKDGRVYIALAKTGLWTCSATLSAVIVMGVKKTLAGDPAMIGNVVQACQVLSMIAITVLGYHGYKGTRIFHALRHWNDGNDSVSE